MCAVTPGPDADELDDDSKPEFILEWIYPPRAQNLAFVKKGQLAMEFLEWRNIISSSFQPYWNCMKNCIWRIKQKLVAKQLTHDIFIEYLQDTLDHLPDDDLSTEGDDKIMPNGSIMEELSDGSDIDDRYETPTPAPRSHSQKRALELPVRSSIIFVDEHTPRFKRTKNFHSMDAGELLYTGRKNQKLLD